MPSFVFSIFSPLVDTLREDYRVALLFLYKHNRFPDLKKPISFSEKVQWRKLYDRNPLYSLLVDKYAVKGFVESIGLNLVVPKVLWRGNSLSSFDASLMPDRFVLKASHSSGTNLIVSNKTNLSGVHFGALERKWRKVRLDKTFVEWAYSGVPVRFFAEEYLVFGGKPIDDYKFWVFSGRVEFIQVDVGRYDDHRRNFYSRDWVGLDFMLTYPKAHDRLDPPDNLYDMIYIAESLGSSFDFVRIDLYSDGFSVFFGEYTFYPGSGYERFSPVEKDVEIGRMWTV